MSRPLVAAMLAALVAGATVLLVDPTAANHTQTDLGKSIAFDHKTGNVHWVEVVAGGADADKVTRVEVQVGAPNSHGWRNLPKLSWGPYGASIPIGDPADVRFRATFTDGTMAVSCWFRHPSGAEVCSYPPPPGNWRAASVGHAGTSFGGEVELADIDRDGTRDVVVASQEALFVFDHSATGWVRSTAFHPGTADQDFTNLAIGSTDGDDVLETYTAGRHFNGSSRVADRVMWHHFTGEQWFSEVVWDFFSVSDLAVGDVDDDGSDELLIVTYDGARGVVYAVKRSPGSFAFTEVARSADGGAFGRAAVADADRDGDQELYLTARLAGPERTSAIVRVDRSGSSYTQDTIVSGQFGEELTGFVAGDATNDGQDELYLLTPGFFAGDPSSIRRFSPVGTGWVTNTIAIGKGFHYGLALGDGDGDGSRELYAGTIEGHLAKVSWSGSSWSARAVIQRGSGEFIQDVVTGDADGDGKGETYALAYETPTDRCCPGTQVLRFAPSGGSTSTTTTTTSGDFAASFTGVRGNEWWVQAQVAANRAVAKVDVTLDNGATWKPLGKESWGWAASYHITQGTIVRLRATATDGQTDLSSCRQWIPPSGQDAAIVPCSGTSTSTGSTGFDATFSGVKGNNWWVQASASANQALAGVDARVDCSGAWKPLTKQSYGWAASFHVPSGAKVDFRARSTSGAQDLSGGYVWPNATPTSAC